MPKRAVYGIKVLLMLTLIGTIILAPVPSMLKWQSNFLARSFLFLLLCAALCLYRILRGPTAPDRAIAIDMLGILIVGFCAILSLPTGRDWYIDIGIAWALQSFIGIMALAKHLEGKDFDE
ncbi:MAG: monovalent cation/H+ antiporter complex subunit F [Candidatus Omnitrophota bacterium]|nr:monovalent cation/H+ antiporter complex subunit F [Candidatus Omnitrophota bacterium]